MLHDPIAGLCEHPGGAMAILISSEGGFPRRAGAIMALWPDGKRIGRLGAGCIDADIAAQLERPGAISRLTYGKGGPIDLPLPCGGTVNIALLRRPDPSWLNELASARQDRQQRCWEIDLQTGQLTSSASMRTGLVGERFSLNMYPPCAMQVYGEGDEFSALLAMADGLGMPCYAGDDSPRADAQTAVVTLFHDHDRELPALRTAIDSPAFYIGALGSRRSQMTRLSALREFGLDHEALARVRGPIGVVSPAREPRLLAASVLTEILAEYDRLFG